MNTITPLMREALDILDTHDGTMQEAELVNALWAKHPAAHMLDDVFDSLQRLVALELLIGPTYLSDLTYSITDTGCEALWALQKADAASLVSPQHQAAALRQLNARPVSFNTRAEMRAFLSGAKP